MSEVQTASERITEEVTSWPGVTAGPGRRGEFAFKVGGREIGHLHGDRSAHFGFPKAVWRELREEGESSRTQSFRTRKAQLRGGSSTTKMSATSSSCYVSTTTAPSRVDQIRTGSVTTCEPSDNGVTIY
jgi:hypothetical protein